MKAKRSKMLLFAVPVMAVLFALLMYEYVFVRIQTEMGSIKESQSIKAKTLEKYVALIAEKPLLEKRLAALKEERKADDSKLVEGKTLSLAAASLQDVVKDIVTQSGGTISSQRVGKPEDLGKFKIITVSIDTILPDARALRDILYALETRTPYLTIKAIDVRIRNFKDPREQVVKLDVSAITGGN